MKLASLKSGRDGRLVVVSRDLARMADATPIALTLQAALDDWKNAAPQLAKLANNLEQGSVQSAAFNPSACAAPLPRAYQWLDGSAYVNHVDLVRRARGAQMPARFWTDPLMYQGLSDALLGPTDDIRIDDEEWGIDFEAEIAMLLGDVPMGIAAEEAGATVGLMVLVNDVSLRNLIPGESEKGLGFIHAKPPSALSPVAVTPDELGEAWDGKRVHLPLLSHLNGQPFGCPNAGNDMTFDYPTLIAHAAKTRPLTAGTMLGGGTVSNRDENGGCGKPIAEGGLGYSCIAERRMVEIILHGAAATPFMQHGDRVRIEMKDRAGRSIFGAIDQAVVVG